MPDTSYGLLDRPVYEIAEVARLLTVADSTLRWWLQGRSYRGKEYLPALRLEANSSTTVSWGEFIEAAMLRFLRRDRDISLRELRLFRCEVLARHPQIRHPLATDELYLQGGRLSLKELAGIWEPSTGTVFPESAAREFFERCNWQDHVATGFQPRAEQPRVRVEPNKQFGAPQLHGVRTQALFDLELAGESVDLLAKDFRLDVDEVCEAINFERSLRGIDIAA